MRSITPIIRYVTEINEISATETNAFWSTRATGLCDTIFTDVLRSRGVLWLNLHRVYAVTGVRDTQWREKRYILYGCFTGGGDHRASALPRCNCNRACRNCNRGEQCLGKIDAHVRACRTRRDMEYFRRLPAQLEIRKV